MRLRLQLAAAVAPFALANALAAAQLVHSPQITLHRAAKPEDLSWLLAFAQPAPSGRENQLALDPRFHALLRRTFTAPQSFWNSERREPLHEVALEFLGGPPGDVLLTANRYLTADACVAHFCPDRGLFFADLGTRDPLLVFAAIDWISDNHTTGDKDATYSLWVFANRPLDPALLPVPLIDSIRRWSAQPSSGSNTRQNITRAFLVDPDGTPHTLAPAAIGAHNALPPETITDSEAHP